MGPISLQVCPGPHSTGGAGVGGMLYGKAGGRVGMLYQDGSGYIESERERDTEINKSR